MATAKKKRERQICCNCGARNALLAVRCHRCGLTFTIRKCFEIGARAAQQVEEITLRILEGGTSEGDSGA